MIKELKEEIKFMVKHPIISLVVIGTITGVLPALLIGSITNILGI